MIIVVILTISIFTKNFSVIDTSNYLSFSKPVFRAANLPLCMSHIVYMSGSILVIFRLEQNLKQLEFQKSPRILNC